MTNPLPQWAVAVVREEFKTRDRLRDIGVEYYCPIIVRRIRQGRMRRLVDVDRPMLKGYLPIKHATVTDPQAVYDIPGFLRFLRWEDGCLMFATDAEIDRLRMIEAEARHWPAGLGALIARFLVGETLRVDGGPFGGMRGVVEEASRDRTTIGGLDFGRYPTEFPNELLEAAE